MGKSKTIYGYSIGANVMEQDAPTGVKLVPDNKTLMVLPLNDDHDLEVQPTRLKSIKEVYSHYQPSKEVDFKTANDENEEMTLKFNQLKDFSRDGIIAQSKVLQELEEKYSIYSKLADVLKHNEKLKNVLSDETDKKEFVELLDTLIEELTEAE